MPPTDKLKTNTRPSITMEYTGPWVVKLTYFKRTGKYAYEGEYTSEKLHLFEIWEELDAMLASGKCPGLVDGQDEFYVLVEVLDHPHNHPHLHIPSVV